MLVHVSISSSAHCMAISVHISTIPSRPFDPLTGFDPIISHVEAMLAEQRMIAFEAHCATTSRDCQQRSRQVLRTNFSFKGNTKPFELLRTCPKVEVREGTLLPKKLQRWMLVVLVQVAGAHRCKLLPPAQITPTHVPCWIAAVCCETSRV